MSTLPPLPAPPVVGGPYAPFWDAIDRGRLALPRCAACDRFAWYPADRCPACGGGDFEWVPVSGRATLFTFTVVHRSFLSPEPLAEPYGVGLVEPADAPGVRLVGLLAEPPSELRIGMPLEVAFEESAGRRVPVWRRA